MMKSSTSARGIWPAILLTSSVVISPAMATTQPLDDASLREVSGQAAFFTDYIAPGGSNPNANIGFYKLGIQGTTSLNANINRLQLGCGGVKGSGCDIDLSQASLTGISPGPSGTYVDSDATLTNPFIQLAILNPGTLATRRVVGLNLGAQGALGQLSIGQNTNTPTQLQNGTATAANNTGINTLSGYLGVTLSNVSLPNVNACLGFVIGSGCLGIPIPAPATIASYSQNLTLNRASTVTFGPMTAVANAVGVLPITLSNVNLVNQPLAAVHNILIQDPSSTPSNRVAAKDLSLSLQDRSITYPNSTGWSPAAAQQGWWIALPQISISDVTTYQNIPIGAITALGGVLGLPVNIDPIDLAQQHVANCYGTLKFC